MNDLFRQFMLTPQTDAERDELRERLLADHDLSDQLRDRENNWIDDGAAGKLTPEDAALLHMHLLQTGQLDRLTTAAALARRTQTAGRRSVFPYAIAIAAIVVLCFGVVIQSNRRPSASAVPVLTTALLPGTLRDGREVPKVQIKQRQDNILQLIYQDTAPTGDCRVVIRSTAGPTFDDTQEPCGVNFHAHAVASKLAPGRYSVELATSKGEIIHTYLFDATN